MSKQHTHSSDVFEVEAIVAERTTDSGVEYLVKWKGYESSQNTWEPEENLEEARKVLRELGRSGEEGSGKKRKRLYTATDFPMRFARKYPDPDPFPASQIPQIPEESESSEEEPAYTMHRKAKTEDLEVLSVRVSRGNQLMWSVLEGTGKKREWSLEQVKERAPLALVDFLISKLRFA